MCEGVGGKCGRYLSSRYACPRILLPSASTGSHTQGLGHRIVPTVSQPAVRQIEERRDETRRDRGEGTVPKSPSSLWPSPHLARKSLDPFSFQMLTSVPCHRIPQKRR